LTSIDTRDGGKLTRQLFSGTRATSAVVVGFLGAIARILMPEQPHRIAAESKSKPSLAGKAMPGLSFCSTPD